MSVDWKLLAPHKPVELGSPLYVEQPLRTTLADWVLAGSSAILLGGPAGVGKSSDLAYAASLLQGERVACFAPLDRWENMRALTPQKLCSRLAGRLVHLATQVLRLPVSAALQESVAGPSGDMNGFEHFVASPRVLLEQAIHEVTRLSQKRISFLIDGLEKVPQGPESALLFDELGTLPDSVDVVVVVPWHATFGARPDAIVRPGERFCSLRAVEVSGGTEGGRGQEFLHEIVKRRVGEGAIEMDLLISAAHWSGGLLRTFLQLLSDAASYARLSGGDGPSRYSLESAVLDQQDSFRRLLMPGDTDAIRAAVGTDGRELELTRKVRLMAHGMLLERSRDRRAVLELHPLAQEALRTST